MLTASCSNSNFLVHPQEEQGFKLSTYLFLDFDYRILSNSLCRLV